MTPPARLQAAIDLLDIVVEAARANGAAADTLIARWFAEHRYAGAKDKRAIRDLVYRAVRAFGAPPKSGRAAFAALARHDAEIATAFDGSLYGPAVLDPVEPRTERQLMPSWLGGMIDRDEHAALLARAPLDLRVNRLKTTRAAVQSIWPEAVAVVGLEDALRLDPPIAIEATDAWRDGLVDVQDAGSQWVVQACRAAPEMTAIDLCAGGGGKTLALAAAMAGQGRLVACDTDRTRLSRLAPRAARAEAVIETRLLDPMIEKHVLGDLTGAADLVLVDAPCSGTGTFRRNPEARWRLNSKRLDALVALQSHVLDVAMPLVKPGGVLVYAVCSLLTREGADQAAAFLSRHRGWRAEPPFAVGRPDGPGRKLSPAHDATDGFFVARLIAPC